MVSRLEGKIKVKSLMKIFLGLPFRSDPARNSVWYLQFFCYFAGCLNYPTLLKVLFTGNTEKNMLDGKGVH